MLRAAFLLFLLAAALTAATVRLYLKDGTWHNVREYQKLSDRVRYYSTDRGDWKKSPSTWWTSKKPKPRSPKREAERKEEAKLLDAEEKAERTFRRELEAIPYEAGVYQIKDEKAVTLQNGDTKVVNNKRRSILKAVSPIPIVSGKATVELDGVNASYTVPAGQPEFYVRLADDVRFEIIRLTPGKNTRIVQTWDIIPVSKELVEKTDVVETFKQQLVEGLYKVWPMKPIEPGEYAFAEWVEGKGNVQVWDFTVGPKP